MDKYDREGMAGGLFMMAALGVVCIAGGVGRWYGEGAGWLVAGLMLSAYAAIGAVMLWRTR
jgi:hypothetical protein